MEFSRNQDTEPMRRSQRERFHGVKAVLGILTTRHTGIPFPAMSDHYHDPVVMGDIPAETPEARAAEGWDDMGTPVPYMRHLVFGFDRAGNYDVQEQVVPRDRNFDVV